MKEEILVLMKLKTWTIVPRAEALKKGKKVIKSTWAFRQKRAPDGSPTKKKARFCVRGDLEKHTENKDAADFFQSYSPVVQWSNGHL